MNKSSVFKIDTRTNRYFQNGTIFMSQPRAVISKSFTCSKSFEHLLDVCCIDVKVHDGMAYVLIAGVAHHLQLRVVGAQDCPVLRYPVNGLRRILKKLRQFPFTISHGLLGLLSIRYVDN